MESIFFSSLALSGLLIAWHAFLEDRPSLKTTLKQRSKFFVCGICQVFWGSLLISVVLAPVHVQWRAFASQTSSVLNWLVTWQSLAMMAYLARYVFLLIFESVKEKIRNNHSSV